MPNTVNSNHFTLNCSRGTCEAPRQLPQPVSSRLLMIFISQNQHQSYSIHESNRESTPEYPARKIHKTILAQPHHSIIPRPTPAHKTVTPSSQLNLPAALNLPSRNLPHSHPLFSLVIRKPSREASSERHRRAGALSRARSGPLAHCCCCGGKFAGARGGLFSLPPSLFLLPSGSFYFFDDPNLRRGLRRRLSSRRAARRQRYSSGARLENNSGQIRRAPCTRRGV